MISSPIEWERASIDPVVKAHPETYTDIIAVREYRQTRNTVAKKMFISANLCRQAGLEGGDSIWLYKSGNLFMIKKEPSDFILKRQDGSASKTNSCALTLQNKNFIANLCTWKNGNIFDAWVDGECIIFKPRKEETDAASA